MQGMRFGWQIQCSRHVTARFDVSLNVLPVLHTFLPDIMQAAADLASRKANQTATLDALFEMLFRSVMHCL